jgi:hypothetical protein
VKKALIAREYPRRHATTDVGDRERYDIAVESVGRAGERQLRLRGRQELQRLPI